MISRMFSEIILLLQWKWKEAKIFKRTHEWTWLPCILNWRFYRGQLCGTYQIMWAKWIGYLVKAVQNFRIYLTDYENFGKEGKKSKTNGRILAKFNRWQDYWYLLGMGFLLQLLMPLKELSLFGRRR